MKGVVECDSTLPQLFFKNSVNWESHLSDKSLIESNVSLCEKEQKVRLRSEPIKSVKEIK